MTKELSHIEVSIAKDKGEIAAKKGWARLSPFVKEVQSKAFLEGYDGEIGRKANREAGNVSTEPKENEVEEILPEKLENDVLNEEKA